MNALIRSNLSIFAIYLYNRFMKKRHLLFTLFCGGLLSCTAPTETQQLAKEILADQSFHVVDSMARSVIRSGFNAGSGYSQIWARDMNTFIEVACE